LECKSLVSIVTLTYNHERFISQTIESVLAQTYDDWELIIIDDGSTDQTVEVISKFNDPRIHLVSQSHVGLERLSQTYNKALSLANGTLIAILEGDDCWPPDKLEKQIKPFEDLEVVLSFGLGLHVDENGKVIGKSKGVNFRKVDGIKPRRMFLFGNFITSVTVMIRKDVLLPEGFIGITGIPFVDFPTWFVLTYKGKFVFIDDVLGCWRKYASQTTTKLWLMEKGELRVFNYFKNKQYINFATFILCSLISLAKYLRRFIFWKV